MISGKTIAKNVSVMMASQLTTWVLAFVLAVFLPRYLGAEGVGFITIANSIWAIAMVLVGFGMDTHLTKSVARDPAKTSELLMMSFVVRTAFFVISCVLVAIYANIMRYESTLLVIIALLGMAYLLGSYVGAFVAVFIGLERMEFISITNIVSKSLYTGLSVLLIIMDAGLYFIVVVDIIASLSSFVIFLIMISRLHPLRLQINLSGTMRMLRESSVYLISVLALVVYQQIDNLFIANLVDTTTVGWYSIAMSLFGTLMFLPVVFGTVIFPSLTRSYASGDAKLNIIAQRSFDLMFLMSVPVGLGMVVIAKPLIALLYGPDFAPTGSVMMLLGFVLIFTYLNTVLGQLLISVDRTSSWNIVMIVAIFVTLPLDYILVPWTDSVYGNGALGGAFAFLITEFGMVVAAVLLLPRHTLQWSNVRTAMLTLFAGLLMMSTSWWFRDTMMLVSILVGGITYGAAVMVLRIIPREDLLLITNAVMNLLGRLRHGKESAAGPGN